MNFPTELIDDRLVGINEKLDRIADVLVLISDSLEKLVPNPYTGRPA